MIWLRENIGTVLIAALLACALGAIVWRVIDNKRKGKGSCGCGCSSCEMSAYCKEKREEKK